MGNEHNHNGYYGNYPNTCSSHDEPSADTDADRDEPHTQEPSTSEVSTMQMVIVFLVTVDFGFIGSYVALVCTVTSTFVVFLY